MIEARVGISRDALPGSGGAGLSPLVGREREVGLVGAALARVASGSPPAVVVLSGPAGVGKTRLGQEGLALAESAGFATFAGRAIGLIRDVAYAPLVEAFGGWLRNLDERRRLYLVGDLPQLGLVMGGLGIDVPAPLGDAMLERARLMEGFARLVGRLAGERPVALLLDDLDRADPATAALVLYLAATVIDQPVLLLVTARREGLDDDRVGDLLSGLSGSTWTVEEQVLAPLDEADARYLMEHLLGGPVEPRLARLVVERAAGRPLFLEAVTRTLAERGLLAERDGTLHLAGNDIPLPGGVRAHLRQRLTQLGAEERDLLGMLAASGGSIGAELLAHAMGRTAAQILEALGVLYQRGLIVASERPATYDVAHGLLRDTVLAELTPMDVSVLHARLAEALMDVRPEDPRIPEHVLAAGPLIAPHRALAELTWGAGHAERLGAPENMLRYLDRAVAIARDIRSVEALGDLLAGLCRGSRWMGDAESATRHGREAIVAYAAVGDALGVARLERELAMLAWSRGDLDGARVGLAAARGALEGLEPSAEHGWLLHAEMITAIRVLDEPAIEAAAGRLHQLVERLDFPSLRVQAYLAEGALRLARTDYVAATESTRQALEAGTAGGVEDVSVIRAHDQLSVAAACQLDLESLRRHSDAALQAATALGAPVLQWWPRGRLVLVDLLAGQWDAALRGCAEVLALLDRVGERRGAVSGIAAYAWLLVHLGRLSDARHQLHRARDLARPGLETDRNIFNAVILADTSLALAEGDPVRAREVGAPLEELRGGWFPTLAAATLGEAMLACGDIDGARRVCRRIAGVRSCSTQLPEALTAWLEGQAEVSDGQPDRAAQRLRVARAEFDRLGLPFHAARAALAVASAVEESAPGEAVEAGRRALEVFETLGAPLESQQARELLRRLGIVPSRGRTRSKVKSPLSDRELEVASLVAKGLSNADVASKLFISPRTVTTHLNRMYARLGLSSRVALTRYLLDSDLLDRNDTLQDG